VESRALGQQGPTVSAIGYRATGTAVGNGPTEDTESIAAIRRAHELGVTHFDTADVRLGSGREAARSGTFSEP
jgi:aryl-alcohol dehydrogenase-like predicted oxidoreductase